jgi:hypothetical protein
MLSLSSEFWVRGTRRLFLILDLVKITVQISLFVLPCREGTQDLVRAGQALYYGATPLAPTIQIWLSVYFLAHSLFVLSTSSVHISGKKVT